MSFKRYALAAFGLVATSFARLGNAVEAAVIAIERFVLIAVKIIAQPTGISIPPITEFLDGRPLAFAGGSPHVDRHEAGTARRAAARGI